LFSLSCFFAKPFFSLNPIIPNTKIVFLLFLFVRNGSPFASLL
jgi:hypothetical protein